MDNRMRYEGIDGLKAYAIIGIALMHVLANGKYGIGGFVFERLIPSFTNLVFLFMMVSGFGMCCGYYQKIVDQKISVEDFYKKRYIKIWPYFALLCALDFVISPSKESLFEVFANLTLCQGLLPNMRIEVIGVSWTLAVIFVFYMLFPFFCFLIGNKKRAWGVAVVALVFNLLCGTYFFDGKHIVDLVNGGKSCMAGFVLKNTLSDNGGVTRGICKMDEQNNLTEVVETKNIVKTATGAEADGVAVDVNSLVSMNMWGLTPDFLDVLEEGFKEFFEKEVPGNPLKAEYLIPIFIGELLEQGKMSVKVLKTNDTWYGMTYHEDVAAVKGSFKEMLENGVYKADLFSDL